jgi:hypothetical protein
MVALVALAGCNSSSNAPRSCPRAAGITPRVAAPTSPTPTGSIDPNIDNGQQILITGHGFLPHWLVSIVDEDVVWWNQTSRTQRIRFENGTVDSGPIKPGDSFAYKPSDSVSIPYASVADPHQKGVIQVEPFLDPGETPFKCPPSP